MSITPERIARWRDWLHEERDAAQRVTDTALELLSEVEAQQARIAELSHLGLLKTAEAELEAVRQWAIKAQDVGRLKGELWRLQEQLESGQSRIAQLEEALDRLIVYAAPRNALFPRNRWICTCGESGDSLEEIEHLPNCAWVVAQRVSVMPRSEIPQTSRRIGTQTGTA